MTLAEIMHLALRQLDEDPADVSEHDDLMRTYAGEGYQIVMRDFYKPRETICLRSDGAGRVSMEGIGAERIVALRAEDGQDVWHEMTPDGKHLQTGRKNARLTAVCERESGMLEKDMDVPQFPEWAHGCLADYICYRHLSGGNLIKQQRAQFFLNRFLQSAKRIRPQGMGSVTRIKNLYEVTDARYGG